MQRSPPSCANCGADIPPQSRACPECGADERTGWAEQDIYDGLDLPPDPADVSSDNRTSKSSRFSRLIWPLVALLLALIVASRALGLW